MSVHVTAGEAARNNAEWCATFCRTHQIETSFESDYWFSAERTPPLYPDAVTLRATVDVGRLLERIDATGGAAIKDSFACLDLEAAGFERLFHAEWLLRDTPPEERTAGRDWCAIDDADELRAWQAAWSGETAKREFFRRSLLRDSSVAILGCRAGNEIVAGAIANRSARVVGLSNVFDTRGDLESAWAGSAAAAAARWSSPLVGYDSQESLAAAQTAGFRSIGELVVWLKP